MANWLIFPLPRDPGAVSCSRRSSFSGSPPRIKTFESVMRRTETYTTYAVNFNDHDASVTATAKSMFLFLSGKSGVSLQKAKNIRQTGWYLD